VTRVATGPRGLARVDTTLRTLHPRRVAEHSQGAQLWRNVRLIYVARPRSCGLQLGGAHHLFKALGWCAGRGSGRHGGMSVPPPASVRRALAL
jgi:hypothetical protein